MKKTKFLASLLCVVCLLSSILVLNSCQKGTRGLSYTLNSDGTSYSVSGYTGKKHNVEIPESYKGLPVTSISEEAFKGNTVIETVIVPNSVTVINDEAFAGCTALKSADLPDTLTSLGYGCFQNCNALTELKIPEGIKKLPMALFENCSSLETVAFPSTLETISPMLFKGCYSLSTLTVATGNTLYHSKDNCIIETATKSLVLGAGDSVIPSDGSVVAIAENAFLDMHALATLTIPEAVKTIGSGAFSNCKNLRFARIDGATEIGDSAFSSCSNMRYVTIPKELTTVGNYVFSGCLILQKVYYESTSADFNRLASSSSVFSLPANSTVFFFSAEKPETNGNFWYYGSDNTISTWTFE